MLATDLEYRRPETAEQAVQDFAELDARGLRPLYKGGGTEIISLGRQGEVDTGAIIDLKGIPQCAALGRRDGHLVLGAAVDLARICAEGAWPLLAAAAGRVADHTSRCQITLGGNIAGSIAYREAALPLWLTDCRAAVAGPGGVRHVPFADVFDGAPRLGRGEFLVQLLVPHAELARPGVCIKRTRLDWVDYPLLTVAAVRREPGIGWAFSGLCDRPVRSSAIDAALGEAGVPAERRAERALALLPGPVLDDLHGSAAYRRFVLQQTVRDIMAELRG